MNPDPADTPEELAAEFARLRAMEEDVLRSVCEAAKRINERVKFAIGEFLTEDEQKAARDGATNHAPPTPPSPT